VLRDNHKGIEITQVAVEFNLQYIDLVNSFVTSGI